MFEGWKGRPGWVREEQIGHLFRNRADVADLDKAALGKRPRSAGR
jgi:hypothetical protein